MIATLIVRIFQVLFAACVLGLSITAVKWQYYGTAPAVSSFNAFAGAFALLTALIGIVAIWISHIPGLIMAVVDGVAFIFLLAGGIAYAVKLKGVSCGAYNADSWSNPGVYAILNGGDSTDAQGNPVIGVPVDHPEYLQSRCHTAEADTAFLFLCCITCIAAGVLAVIAHRRSGNGKHSAV